MTQQAPIPEKIDKTLEIHGHKRVDSYFWMNDVKNPNVLEHLNAENSYLSQSLSHTDEQQKQLFGELKGRIKETDASSPMKDGEYWYYYRYEKGKQYPLYCRSHGSPDNVEEIILDQNALAEGKSFYDIGFVENSPDHKWLAYSVDEDGDECYRLFIKNLASGELQDAGVDRVASSFEWLADSQSFLFTMLDENFRPRFVYRSQLGDKITEIKQVFEEKDPGFFIWLDESEDRKFKFICLHGNNSSESWYSENSSQDLKFEVIEGRSPDHEYDVTHLDGKFIILSNWKADNFAIYESEVGKVEREKWDLWQEYDPKVLTESITIFENFIVIEEKERALPRIRILDRVNDEEFYIDYGQEPCELSVTAPLEYGTDVLRYSFSSMASPSCTYDYHLPSQTKKVVKVQEIPDKSFDANNYTTKRVYIEGKDGTSIPVSLLYRNDLKVDGKQNLYLYAYGSYGSSMEPGFSSSRFSYVDRGMIYAIAHVRGGMELGRQWYLDGKLKKKQNTFDDFISVAEGLIDLGYSSKGRLVAKGGSAGGLLIGAVANQRPDLFGAMIADVPFVDVLTTMLDSSLPLTTIEYNEWGNPEDKSSYDYIKTYSPYDNVKKQDYPPLLVICGLNDMRVTYWEPAKWVAKLREYKSNDNPVYLKTHMDAGHAGASGRYDYLKDLALEIAFVLETLPS